jgi:hypothetical protein
MRMYILLGTIVPYTGMDESQPRGEDLFLNLIHSLEKYARIRVCIELSKGIQVPCVWVPN